MIKDKVKDKVCLVIPLYNKEKYILNTLQSVLKNHGYDNFECIVVDDESTDGSADIAQRFCKEYEDIFTYVRIQHKGRRGPANARNIGIRMADGEFICFLDADDELCEGFISRAIENYSKHDIDLYLENFYISFTPEDKQYFECEYGNKIINSEKWIKEHYLFGPGYIPHFCCAVYKTEKVKNIMFGDVNAEDFVFLQTYIYIILIICYLIQIILDLHIINISVNKIKYRQKNIIILYLYNGFLMRQLLYIIIRMVDSILNQFLRELCGKLWIMFNF